ncbi:hypothetical protein ABVK25_005465 [Lepraria finkii]|uniref:Uncharacterized protein n=1 Tax=Lepraria finkii TaxID=1340010 RepID=A0ABR4B912_9LECA
MQVILSPGQITGRATSSDIADAALILFDTCVIPYGYGGLASNIGGDDNLEVAISNYKPNVKCSGGRTRGPPWQSCVLLFTEMRADMDILLFGQRPVPGLNVQLPLLVRSRK